MRCENCGGWMRESHASCRRCGMIRSGRAAEVLHGDGGAMFTTGDGTLTPFELRGDESDDELRMMMREACPICAAKKKH